MPVGNGQETLETPKQGPLDKGGDLNVMSRTSKPPSKSSLFSRIAISKSIGEELIDGQRSPVLARQTPGDRLDGSLPGSLGDGKYT